MKPLALDLQNARTFDSLHYDFTEGVTAVTGANGSGKSTLVSALDVALFGAESRSLADWLSTDRPEQTMTIALTFEHAGETYRVRRTFSGKGRGTTKVDLEVRATAPGFSGPEEYETWLPLTRESASATQEELERIIGLNRDTFRASAYLAQGQASVFCEATPGRRKEILASVLGLQVWDGYREKARAELKDAEQSLAVVRAKIADAETDLQTRGQLALGLFAAKDREEAARAALTESESQLVQARERLSALRQAAALREAAERATRAAEDSLASLSGRIAATERRLKETQRRLAEKPGLEVVAEGLPGLVAEQASLDERLRGFEERRRLELEHEEQRKAWEAANRRAAELRERAAVVLAGVGAETCDRCGQTLHEDAARRAAASYGSDANDALNEANRIQEQTFARVAKIGTLPSQGPLAERVRQVADLIRLGREAQTKLAALAEVADQKSALEVERDQMRAESPEREDAVATARAGLDALGPHDPAATKTAEDYVYSVQEAERIHRGRLDALVVEIARLSERLDRLERLAAEVAGQQAERDRHEQDVELLTHLERACGPNGVPALILETSAIPQLEAEWNRLLQLLPTDSGDLFEVELHTQRERKTGSGPVDALDVIVYANGHSRPYSTYSGGEQMRLAIAQRRALSNLLAHRRGADCPLMILDEPNSLDDAGMAALAQVLQDLAAAEDLTVLVVSHDPALRDAFEQNVEIEKTDGRSRIVGVSEPEPIMEAV